MARAISSLPVPDSPVIRMRVRVGATLAIWANSAAIGALRPTISKRSSVIARRPCTSRSIARRSTALRSATINRSRSSGFSIRSYAPALVARTASASVAWPEIMMIVGADSRFFSFEMRSIVSSPDMPGSWTSSRTTSAAISAMRASASSPLDASSTA